MNRRPTEQTERSHRLAQQRQQRQIQQMSMSLSNRGSPALTIDNDSFSSIRPHIMGHPGARVHPPLLYAAASPVNDATQLLTRGRSDRQQDLLMLRRSTTENRSPFDISRHSALHRQLLLVPTPNLNGSQSLVGRLSVVRPSSDDIIVVEAKRPAGASAAEGPASVEAIYQVIGSSIIDPRRSTHTVVAQSPSSPPPPPPPPPQLETRTPSIADRPIAIPKSRLGKLRPAQRNLPTSREVVEAGPVYTRDGSLRARRPESIILAAKEEAAAEPPVIEITDSYCNDIGYDLASAEIDSLYCRSFDIDLLPDAPERRLSFYNIGVNEVPAKEPEVAKPALVEAVRPHHTLGIPSTGLPFAKPNIREDNVDFYIRMLTLRSSTNPPQQQQPTSPVSPAKTLPDPVVRSTSAASAHHQHRHYYSQHYSQRRSRRSQRQNRRPLTPKHRIVEEVESNRPPPPVSAPAQLPTLEPAAQCIELPSVDCLRIQLPRRMSTSSGHFFFRRRPKSVPSYEAHTSGGEWPATTTTLTPRPPQQVLGEKIPAMSKSTTAATLPYTSTAPAARRWPWLGRAKSADRVLLPPTHIASSSSGSNSNSDGSVVASEASGQLRQRRSAAYGAPLAQPPVNRLEASDDASESPGCGLACDSCWPTWTTTARRRQQQQQQQASSGNLSNSRYQQSGLLPSLASSWAHIYRSRPRNQSSQQHVGWREQRRIRRQNQQQRSVRVRDVLAYPFQLGYNCLLWWLGPCVGLARECR